MLQLTIETFKERIIQKLNENTGKAIAEAKEKDIYETVAALVNEALVPHWEQTAEKYRKNKNKQVYYLSMEFLIGSLLESNLLNCALLDISSAAIEELGFEASKVYATEHDAGLGNGGLGRLAAGFLDSLASLNYAGHGYGIRYHYGMFEQRFIHGHQIELPDNWLHEPYPWERRVAEDAVKIQFGGHVQLLEKQNGYLEVKYEQTDDVLAVPYDIPIVGYHNDVVNTLRLFRAEPVHQEQENIPKEDDTYYHNLDHHHDIEQISGFLYPDDSDYEGKELRLKQQYFLVSSSLQDIIRYYKETNQKSLHDLPEKVVIQINDTHPSLAIPEMMRILMDEEQLSWEVAWDITMRVMAYTNHTTLIEAFAKWPIKMMQAVLPRMYMIIDEINERFCQGIWFDYPELRDKIPEMAIIAYDQVHMAHLAIVGSFSINGVATLHTEILKKYVLNDFYKMYPKRFNNKTNGITHRRWLLQSNPKLSELITDVIGPNWVHRPKELIQLVKYSSDHDFLEKVGDIKLENKRKLARFIYEQTGITVDEQSIFDVQIKRLHEYKRQLLKVFHIMYLYHELQDNPDMDITPKTFIFGAKAAPGYHLAKETIKLINYVASIINNDASIDGKLKVVFLENYNVSLAEKIIPAADISEQISTASKEASGTGNMKMMMNGALTVGTLDGANVEIKEAVGDDNIFIFGLTEEEVFNYQHNGSYSAMDLYHSDDRISNILDQLNQGFESEEPKFQDIYYNILYHNDPYFVLRDFEAYINIHEHVEQAYRDKMRWLRMSVMNIASSGKFSSDRTIQEYAAGIWKIKPV